MLEFLEDAPKSCLIFVVLFETNWDMEGCLFAGSPLHLISRMIVRTHYDIRISQRSQSSPGNAMVLWMSVFKEPRCILLREWFCMRILPVTLIFLLDSGTAVVWLVVPVVFYRSSRAFQHNTRLQRAPQDVPRHPPFGEPAWKIKMYMSLFANRLCCMLAKYSNHLTEFDEATCVLSFADGFTQNQRKSASSQD